MRFAVLFVICLITLLALGANCLDSTPPGISWLYPKARDTIYLGDVELAARVYDQSGVEHVEFRAADRIMTAQRCPLGSLEHDGPES